MGLVTRYFSTTAAGAGDGTTWADRAALIVSGSFNTIISGFNFTSDSLNCIVGPGTYTHSGTTLSPTIPLTSTLVFVAGDSSGNAMALPLEWTSDQPAFSTTGFPVIVGSANVTVSSVGVFRGFKFESNGVTNRVFLGAGVWCQSCHLTFTSSNSESHVSGRFWNCVLISSSSSLVSVWGSTATNILSVVNTRFECVGTPTGAADAITTTATSNGVTLALREVVVVGFPGYGFADLSTMTLSRTVIIQDSVIVGCGAGGILFAGTTGQTATKSVSNCVITGNGGVGINGQSGSNVHVVNCRLRDNTTANLSGLGNYELIHTNDVSTGSDADEYNAKSGSDPTTWDLRIKPTAAFAGKGIGVSQMPAPGGSTIIIIEGDD